MIERVILPAEILEVALKRQVEQGNPSNIDKVGENRYGGGFLWRNTPEGYDYWQDVMNKYKVNEYEGDEDFDDGDGWSDEDGEEDEFPEEMDDQIIQ